jgi:hypothetical protein
MASVAATKRRAHGSAEDRGEWAARRLNGVIRAIRADDAPEVHALAEEVIERAPEATGLLELAAEFAARKGAWAAAVRYRAAVSAAKPEDRPATVHGLARQIADSRRRHGRRP